MSFESLPEEILGKITKLTSDACYYDAQYFAELDFAPEPGRDIWCAERGLASLASVNSQMRRICTPILFSRLLILAPSVERKLQPWKVSSLQLFRRLLSQRPHIAEHVLSIGAGRDVKFGWWYCCARSCSNMWFERTPYLSDGPEQISELVEIISLLPNLQDICHDSLNEDFIRALVSHNTLKRVDSSRYVGWDLNRDSVPSLIPLHRWYLADLPFSRDGDNYGVRHILSLGVNVAHLKVRGQENILLNVSSYNFNAIERLYIEDIEQIDACVVLDFAESMACRHPELRKMLISSFTSHRPDTLSRTPQNFPLLGSLISSTMQKFNNGQQEQIFNDFGYIVVYTIRKTSKSNDFFRSADTWSLWSITSLEFCCYQWPLPTEFLHALAGAAPSLHCLKLVILLMEPGFIYIDAELLGDGLNASRTSNILRFTACACRLPTPVWNPLSDRFRTPIHSARSSEPNVRRSGESHSICR